MKSTSKTMLVILLLLSLPGTSQVAQRGEVWPFSDIVLRIDTLNFRWSEDQYVHQDETQLAFQFSHPNPVVQVTLPLAEDAAITGLKVRPSDDYTLVDSLIWEDNAVRFRLRFKDIPNSGFLQLGLHVQSPEGPQPPLIIPLFPYTSVKAELDAQSDELYLGERKVVELLTNRPENVDVDPTWNREAEVEYRLEREGSRILVHLLPREKGVQEVVIPLTLKKPVRTGESVQYQLRVKATFDVKTTRLAFLRLNRDEVTLREGSTEAIEVQIEDHRFLRLNKTYRIENREEPGGALISELFTQRKLSNDRVLALLRPYGFHRPSEGYLYLKEGDQPRFITNFRVSPKTQVEKIWIQREGEDWRDSRQVFPGEVINLRLEGQGLHKGEFSFYGIPVLNGGDSLVRNENEVHFRLRIPLDIDIRQIEIYHNDTRTGHHLKVNEYQRPKPFDWIDLELGAKRYRLSDIHAPIYYTTALSDLVIDFDPRKIDRSGQLNGRQHLSIKVKISNKEGNLIELYSFDDLVICPGDNSPRFAYYNDKNCRLEDINLNEYIARKTHNLPGWSTIELEISHRKDRYGGDGFSKKVQVILKREIHFDMDVSFPAGLLILKDGENDFSNFSGISFAMIAQMSFYHPEKIAKLRPYKLGAGFIAVDAFNFAADNTNRDVGLVIIGSLYPTSSENKLSFPLFAGYGYLLQEQKGFFLIGPGIRVRL